MNVVESYIKNPMFDGVMSAITTQGEVTVNLRGNRREVNERRHNKDRENTSSSSYGGAHVWDNLHAMPHELGFAWKRRISTYSMSGEFTQNAWTSLNGVHYGKYKTDEAMEDAIYFVALIKTPFIFDSLDQVYGRVWTSDPTSGWLYTSDGNCIRPAARNPTAFRAKSGAGGGESCSRLRCATMSAASKVSQYAASST